MSRLIAMLCAIQQGTMRAAGLLGHSLTQLSLLEWLSAQGLDVSSTAWYAQRVRAQLRQAFGPAFAGGGSVSSASAQDWAAIVEAAQQLREADAAMMRLMRDHFVARSAFSFSLPARTAQQVHASVAREKTKAFFVALLPTGNVVFTPMSTFE